MKVKFEINLDRLKDAVDTYTSDYHPESQQSEKDAIKLKAIILELIKLKSIIAKFTVPEEEYDDIDVDYDIMSELDVIDQNIWESHDKNRVNWNDIREEYLYEYQTNMKENDEEEPRNFEDCDDYDSIVKQMVERNFNLIIKVLDIEVIK